MTNVYIRQRTIGVDRTSDITKASPTGAKNGEVMLAVTTAEFRGNRPTNGVDIRRQTLPVKQIRYRNTMTIVTT